MPQLQRRHVRLAQKKMIQALLERGTHLAQRSVQSASLQRSGRRGARRWHHQGLLSRRRLGYAAAQIPEV